MDGENKNIIYPEKAFFRGDRDSVFGGGGGN